MSMSCRCECSSVVPAFEVLSIDVYCELGIFLRLIFTCSKILIELKGRELEKQNSPEGSRDVSVYPRGTTS